MLEGFTWFRQSAYRWRGEGLTVYIDPWGVTTEDAADLILVTHAHDDHFQPEEIERLRTGSTQIVAPADIANELSGNVTPIAPGDAIHVAGVSIQAVPAYNVVEHRLESHPKSNGWVGYVLTLGDTTYFHAGDTDHVPELESVKADVTFLPVGGAAFTMDVREAAGLARKLAPQIAVPMHYGFVVGSAGDGERFAREAQPVTVQLLEPTNPFEITD